MTHSFYAKFGKRLLDATLAAFGLLLLSPFLALVAIAVRLSSPGPAIFRQIRTGQFEKPFFILKFRSMRPAPAGKGALLTAAGDPRVTPLGYWLRKTKIDELPQLWNVVRGEMSLVGPRPEVPLYTSQYTARQKRVLDARPGITSPQINFDEEALMASHSDKEAFYLSEILPAKLECDLAYCQNVRFATDLKILFGTVAQLFLRPLGLSRASRAATAVTRVTPSSPDA
ncbi:MAG: sugar transferase [Candidatus Acidiferrum sp.]